MRIEDLPPGVPIIKCEAEEIRSVDENGNERVDVIIRVPSLAASPKPLTDNEKEN